MYTLYHHGSSVCSGKVRMALHEKGLSWQGVYIDILKGEQFDERYLKLNPKAVVPTLRHDQRVIVESTVICEYLDMVDPDSTLHPRDPGAFAQARYWTKAVDEDLHPNCAVLTFVSSHRHTLARLGPQKLEEFLSSTPAMSVTSDWKHKKRLFVEQGYAAPGATESVRLYDHYLRKMNQALEQGVWLLGASFSIADVSLAPYVNRLAMMSMQGMWGGKRLPALQRWWERLQARPSFKPSLLDWVPPDLTRDLRENGARSWPEVARILGIAA
jgi:ganglioside-induced differentiation-associated protein 1